MRYLPVVLLLAAAPALAGCGNSSPHTAAPPAHAGAAPPPATTQKVTTRATPSTTTASPAPNALQAEAASAAAGDIPDNQVFLSFTDRAAGFSMKYPEGWAQQGSGARVTFRDKNNIVRVVVGHGPRPTAATVKAATHQLRHATTIASPQALTIGGTPAFKVVYTTQSAPNPVTGKRVKLVVDRYFLWRHGRSAVVDLGTPEGVDNVDAYRLMIESFRWR